MQRLSQMKMRENNLIEICEVHGFVYPLTLKNYKKCPRIARVPCRCYDYDMSKKAKLDNYNCRIRECENKYECIFNKAARDNCIKKNKRPILIKIHHNSSDIYYCIHYNYNESFDYEEETP